MINIPSLFGINSVFLSCLILFGCGDSAFNDTNTNENTNSKTTTLVSISVPLDGSQQVPQSVQTAATGTAELSIDIETNIISGSVTVTNASDRITAMHIHQGVAGTTGSVVVPFEQSPANESVWNIAAGTVITNEQRDTLLAGGMYINVHTANHTLGEIRGQIVGPDIVVIPVTLNGDNEVPPVNTIGRGIGYVTVNTASGDTSTIVRVDNITGTLAHIHQAFAGNNGAPIVTLSNSEPGLWQSEAALSSVQLNALLAGELYINVHSSNNPSGDIRGQIAPQTIKVVRTELEGNQQVPDPVVTNGRGVGYLTINTVNGDVYANIRVTDLSGDLTNSHVHQGSAGVNGSPVVQLAESGNDANFWEAESTLNTSDIQALLAGSMYFNVHSSAFTGGELRGQILIPDFEFIQNSVFNTSCSSASCHSIANATPPAGLRLNDNSVYQALVNRASVQVPNLVRVAQGDPENSYLIRKLEGTASVGSQMPPSVSLPKVVIDNIRTWIENGAFFCCAASTVVQTTEESTEEPIQSPSYPTPPGSY